MTPLREALERAARALALHQTIIQRGSKTLRSHYRVERVWTRRSSFLGKFADDLAFSEDVEAGLERVACAYLVSSSLEALRAEARERGLTRADMEILGAVEEWRETVTPP
jgi:hypothetical protein